MTHDDDILVIADDGKEGVGQGSDLDAVTAWKHFCLTTDVDHLLREWLDDRLVTTSG